MDNKQIKIMLNKRGIILLIIFIVAITLRIGLNVARQELFFHTPFLSVLSVDQTDDRTASDAVWYIYAAKGFLNGKGVVSMEKKVVPLLWGGETNKPFAGYIDLKVIDENCYVHKTVPPLYPLFLALCFFIGGFNTLAYFIPQLILSSLTCILIYLIAEEVFDRMVALFAGFTVAFYPDLIFWTSFARTETLFIFLLVLGFLLLIKGNSRKNLFLLYISAVILGFASLTRITLIPFLPFLLIWQAFFFSKNKKESLKVVLFMALIITVVLLPWAIRNHILFGEFTVFSEESGILIGSIENGEQYKNIEINKGYASYEPLMLKIIVFIKDNVKVYLASCWHRFIIYWSPFTYVMRPLAKFYKGLSWLVIFPAAFWGIIISRKKWRRGVQLIIIFIFYYALLHAMSFVDLGLVYRYPIQPFLCIFAGYTFCEIYRSINKRLIL